MSKTKKDKEWDFVDRVTKECRAWYLRATWLDDQFTPREMLLAATLDQLAHHDARGDNLEGKPHCTQLQNAMTVLNKVSNGRLFTAS